MVKNSSYNSLLIYTDIGKVPISEYKEYILNNLHKIYKNQFTIQMSNCTYTQDDKLQYYHPVFLFKSDSNIRLRKMVKDFMPYIMINKDYFFNYCFFAYDVIFFPMNIMFDVQDCSNAMDEVKNYLCLYHKFTIDILSDQLIFSERQPFSRIGVSSVNNKLVVPIKINNLFKSSIEKLQSYQDLYKVYKPKALNEFIQQDLFNFYYDAGFIL